MSLLKYKHWKMAFQLLEYQISRLNDGNKHFRTLSMYFYRSVIALHSDIKSDLFFKVYIESQLFYCMNKEFSVFHYGVPKGKLGNRNYRLLSLPMRLVHYAYGIYLLDLTQEFLDETVRTRKRIHSFYGGNLRIDKGTLILNKDRVWFLEQYRKFQKALKNGIKPRQDTKTVVFSFDISAFYDRLNVPFLLRELESNLSTSNKARLQFNSRRPLEIDEFYRYLMRGPGIPQSDNDIVSDFIAYLYLCLVDLGLEDLISLNKNIQDFSIVRYVDDYYLILQLDNTLETNELRKIVKSIAEQISDLFSDKWKLALNDKARVFDCSKEEDLTELTDKIKRVSNPYAFVSEQNDTQDSIIDRAINILDQLESVKTTAPSKLLESIETDHESLKDIYSEQVQNALKRKDLQERLVNICEDFDFGLIKVSPREFTCLLRLNDEIWNKYLDYLLSLQNPSGRDTNLMIIAHCQNDFKDNVLIEKLANSKHFKKIVNNMQNFNFDRTNTSYFHFNETKILKIKSFFNLVLQGKRRSFAEAAGNLSLAINHLCTEIIELYRYYKGNGSRSNIKSPTARDIITWMEELKCLNSDSISIKNLFDRRNNNGISHSGIDEESERDVEESEYLEYMQAVTNLFSVALENIYVPESVHEKK